MAGREEALERASAYRSSSRDDERKLRQELQDKGQAGLGGALAALTLPALFSDGKDYSRAYQAERAVALEDAGAGDFDSNLKSRYIYDGPYSLITENAVKRINEYVPPGYSKFEPSDLSGAGGFSELLQQQRQDKPDVRRQITVSPGAQPRRLSYEGLTEDDLGPTGQKGYIWANPDEPQYGYAAGNLNRGRQKSRNPAVNFLGVEMPEGDKRQFATTGEVIADESFTTNRGWGERQFEGGDVMFPKEKIAARAEVTAADIYTRMKDMGLSPDVGDFSRDPGKAFKELAASYAEAMRTTPAEALQELATPVPVLGTSERKTGTLPVYDQFQLEGASPEAIRKSGIGSVYMNSDHPAVSAPMPDERRLFLETTDGDRWNVTRHFEVNPALVSPKRRAGDFLRRQSGAGVMAGAGLALDPSINQALQRGDYSEAALVGGTALAAGAAGEAAVKRGLIELAQRGVTAPLRVATAVAPPVAAIQTAAIAERSVPMTKAQVRRDRRDNPASYGAQGPSANQQLLRAEAARRRGGKWKIGPFTVPELGISEAGGLFFR